MTREELDKKIEEARKHSDVFPQDRIDELLKTPERSDEDFSPIRECRKIKIYDFKRPDKFSNQEIRKISVFFETYAREVKRFLACEYDITAKVHLASVDELTFEEFIRSIPTPVPFCTFKWYEGAGMFSVNPCLFYNGFLGGSIKTNSQIKNHDPNGLEKTIFFEHIYKPFEKILYTLFSDEAGNSLSEITEAKYECNPQFAMNVSNPTGMGILITFVVKIGKTEDYINIFLNAAFIESLREVNFFTKVQNSNFVPLMVPEPNTIVEVGRFRLEDGYTLKEKYIYELNHLVGNPLHIYKDGKYVGDGEAVVIDENKGIQLAINQDTLSPQKEDDFYNTKVIFGGCIVSEDYKFQEACILELNEYIGAPLRIVKDGKTIGWGEVVVADENFAVKVTKVV